MVQATEMVEVWNRWQRGESTKEITDPGQRWIGDSSSTGRVRGHPSRAPFRRSSRALTRIEREEIPEVLRPNNRCVRLPCDWVVRHRR